MIEGRDHPFNVIKPRRSFKGWREFSSSCPNCYREAAHFGPFVGDTFEFDCELCGLRWPLKRSLAARHALFLNKLELGWASEKKEA